MNKLLYISLSISMLFSGYSVGDTISEDHLDDYFSACFDPNGDWEGSFGAYKNNSVIWLNLSASW